MILVPRHEAYVILAELWSALVQHACLNARTLIREEAEIEGSIRPLECVTEGNLVKHSIRSIPQLWCRECFSCTVIIPHHRQLSHVSDAIAHVET